MRKALLLATVFLSGAMPVSAEPQTPVDAPSRARRGAQRSAQSPDPYAKLFETRAALQQALQEKSAPLAAAPKKRVVCGMTVIQMGPDVDPKMGTTPPKDENTRYTIRAVDPPICK